MVKKPFLYVVLLFFLFSACKKTEETPSPNTGNTVVSATEQHIRHNWSFIYNVFNDYGPNPSSDTVHGQPGDYYIFDSDNIAISFWDNVYDTVSYQVLSSSKMLYKGDSMDIRVLTANEFVFARTVRTDTTHFENVIRLTK